MRTRSILFLACLIALLAVLALPATPATAQGTPQTTAAVGPTFPYVVQPGDTLYSIAARFGTSVQVIMNINSLTSTVIYPGQVLLIPGTPPPPSTTEVIVDDLDPGFQRGGDPAGWNQTAIGYRNHIYWTFNNQTPQPNFNWARWYALLTPGYYEVYAYIPSLNAFGIAHYEIYHADGYSIVPIDQTPYSDQWVSLGTYRWRGDGTDSVGLSDITGQPFLSVRVGFDAMRWVRR